MGKISLELVKYEKGIVVPKDEYINKNQIAENKRLTRAEPLKRYGELILILCNSF